MSLRAKYQCRAVRFKVTVKDGMITSKINGKQIHTGTTDLKEGPFGLQSEGTELYFKNIQIKVLD